MGIVYCILNKINNYRYIGSSTNYESRKKNHIAALRHNNHRNPHLQNAWNKYGEMALEFLILAQSNNDDLQALEQKYLDEEKPEYNISLFADAPMRGKHWSKEHIEAMRIKAKKLMTKEKLLKLQEGRRKNRLPKKTKPKLSKDEITVILRNAQLKLWANPEHKMKMSNAHKKYSDESKNNISRGVKRAWENNPSAWSNGRKGKGRAKHSVEEIIEIKKEHFENKKTAKQIAKERNESYHTIRSILYLNWKWIDDNYGPVRRII